MDFAHTLETLGRLDGQRALVIESGSGKYIAPIARHFKEIEMISTASSAGRAAVEIPANVRHSGFFGGDLPYESGSFDAVFLMRVLTSRADWSEILREAMRLLRQQAYLVVAEDSTVAATQTQIILMELEKLLCDRDHALLDALSPSVSLDDVRRELKNLELNHFRSVELSPEDSNGGLARHALLKRECLDRIKLDLLPSLSKLGGRRREFEQRLMDLKRRIEVYGVAPLGLVVFHGVRKTVYAAAEGSLFASEILTAEAPSVALESAESEVAELMQDPAPTSVMDKLPSANLLSLIMSGGESHHRMEKLAQRILKEYGSRAVADERDPRKLVENFGISPTRAAQIVATFELGRRFFASDEEAPVLRGPEDIFAHTSDMAKLKREQFRGLYLDNRQRLVADEVISIGTLTSAILHPREVFRPALTHRAVSVILVHNHPSGESEPSVEDIEMTRQLYEAGRILGIELLDHVIVGSEGWFSMKSADLI